MPKNLLCKAAILVVYFCKFVQSFQKLINSLIIVETHYLYKEKASGHKRVTKICRLCGFHFTRHDSVRLCGLVYSRELWICTVLYSAALFEI